MNRVDIQHRSCRRAFTFVEFLVVIAILSILGAMIPLAIHTAHENSNIANCQTNLRQIGISFNNHDSQLGYLPRPAGTLNGTSNSLLYIVGPFMSACVDTGAVTITTDMKDFHCPSDPG